MADLSGSYEVLKEISHPAIPAVGEWFTVKLPKFKYGSRGTQLLEIHYGTSITPVSLVTIEDWLRNGKIHPALTLLQRAIGAIT